MAIPVYTGASDGSTDAGGAWVAAGTNFVPPSTGVMILQILQDGTTANVMGTPPSVGADETRFTAASNVESLAGTASTLTYIGTFNIGSAATGLQHLWIGRRTSAANPSVSGNNSTSEDLYWRWYGYAPVSTGTTLNTVIENSTAGATANAQATSTTCSDVAVTTLGSDRLALNFVGLSDNAMGLAVFTGASGGTWGNFQIFETATGTDATIAMETADMVSAGTIGGGSDTITSIGWGVVGFALIGTTPDTPVLNPSFLHRTTYKQAIRSAF